MGLGFQYGDFGWLLILDMYFGILSSAGELQGGNYVRSPYSD